MLLKGLIKRFKCVNKITFILPYCCYCTNLSMRWFIDRLQDIDGHTFLLTGQLRPATLGDDDMWQKLPLLTAKCCIYTTALISASRADAL